MFIQKNINYTIKEKNCKPVIPVFFDRDGIIGYSFKRVKHINFWGLNQLEKVY